MLLKNTNFDLWLKNFVLFLPTERKNNKTPPTWIGIENSLAMTTMVQTSDTHCRCRRLIIIHASSALLVSIETPTPKRHRWHKLLPVIGLIAATDAPTVKMVIQFPISGRLLAFVFHWIFLKSHSTEGFLVSPRVSQWWSLWLEDKGRKNVVETERRRQRHDRSTRRTKSYWSFPAQVTRGSPSSRCVLCVYLYLSNNSKNKALLYANSCYWLWFSQKISKWLGIHWLLMAKPFWRRSRGPVKSISFGEGWIIISKLVTLWICFPSRWLRLN